MKRLAALVCRASELPERLEDQLRLSVELASCVVPREQLPTDEQLVAVHAQLARLVREGAP